MGVDQCVQRARRVRFSLVASTRRHCPAVVAGGAAQSRSPLSSPRRLPALSRLDKLSDLRAEARDPRRAQECRISTAPADEKNRRPRRDARFPRFASAPSLRNSTERGLHRVGSRRSTPAAVGPCLVLHRKLGLWLQPGARRSRHRVRRRGAPRGRRGDRTRAGSPREAPLHRHPRDPGAAGHAGAPSPRRALPRGRGRRRADAERRIDRRFPLWPPRGRHARGRQSLARTARGGDGEL